MIRRFLTLLICGLLLISLVFGMTGCKEEETAAPQGEMAPQEAPTQEKEEPAEEETKPSEDFEEEEGVQQEDNSQRDY